MLPEDVRSEIAAVLDRCVHPHCAAVDALLIITDRYRWISDEHLSAVAQLLRMTVEQLDSVASFYNHLYRCPVGRHVILVCDSVSCWIVGYDGIRDYLIRKLGIELGQTTADDRFTLLPIQCLGACEKAPAMMVDEQLYGDLTPELVDEILSRYE
jgi:NADH-quinone oxidoreductase subunit E